MATVPDTPRRAENATSTIESARPGPPAAPAGRLTALRIFLAADGAALLAVLLWSANIPVSKIALLEIDLYAFAVLRIWLGTLLAITVLWVTERNLKLRKEDLLPLGLLGLFGIGATQLLFYGGLQFSLASHVSLFQGLNPLLAVLMVGVLGAGKQKWQNWLGLGICIVGVALLTGVGFSTIDSNVLLGDGLALLSGVTGMAYVVFSRRFLGRYSPLKLQSYALLVSAFAITAVGLTSLLQYDWSSSSLTAYTALGFSSVVGTVVAMVLWLKSVRRIGPVRTSIYQYLLPLGGLAFSLLLLRESFTPQQFVGSAIVLLGMLLALR